MTNDERMTKPEGIRHSGFFRHSCFVIRHSAAIAVTHHRPLMRSVAINGR